VPAGDWFAAEVSQNDSYVLSGCTVAPGFNFDDFEMPNRSSLISQFPQHAAIITKLTRH
jgi:predicted cupin superfamily sugar epimerase